MHHRGIQPSRSLSDIIVYSSAITVTRSCRHFTCFPFTFHALTLKAPFALLNFISPIYKIDVLIKEPKNESDKNLNKQMNDKERLEASNLNEAIVKFYANATINTEDYLEFLKN